MKRVLIVDDEADLIWTLQKNLRNETLDDILLLTACSAEDALMTLGDDRAVRSTYVAGRKLHSRDAG